MNSTGNKFEALVKIVDKLRSPDGCPWVGLVAQADPNVCVSEDPN